MKPTIPISENERQQYFENLPDYQASLLPELPEDLLKGFAASDKRRLIEFTNSEIEIERNAAWLCLDLITKRLEEVFP